MAVLLIPCSSPDLVGKRLECYIRSVDDVIPTPETDAERAERLAWERAALEKAKREAATGALLDGDAVVTWFRSLGTPGELPEPQPIPPPVTKSR